MTDQPDSPEATEDFAALLDSYGDTASIKLHIGAKLDAKVIHAGEQSVFFQISPSQEGFIPREQLVDADGNLTVSVGDRVEAYVISLSGGIELSKKLGSQQLDIEMLEAARDSQAPVEGTVSGFNKGGLEVTVGGGRGFCPIGQVDIQHVEGLEEFVGRTMQFLVREIREGGRNIVLSRRALLERERRDEAEKTLATLSVGQQITGKVTRLAAFGAFVDIGGLDGLIPMAELAHSRVERVEDVLAEGDAVTVEVLRIEQDPKRQGQMRIGLSLKAALADPFDAHADELGEGAVLSGRVTRVEAYGAFVALFDSLEGLVHVSELANRRIGHPREVVDAGDQVEVRVLGVDRERRRISLSLKQSHGQEPGDTGASGDAVVGKVTRIERFGVFVELSTGAEALLPAAESGTPRGTDLARAFPIGTELELQVIAVDDRGRLKVSKTAREQTEERAALREYGSSDPGGQSFGTLGDLLKKKGL